LKRQFAKPCLDWTEREFYLAGSLGTSLLTYLLEHRLLLRSKKTPRVIVLTQQGKDWLKKQFGNATLKLMPEFRRCKFFSGL